MHKKVKAHQEKEVKTKSKTTNKEPVPTFLMDRENQGTSKVLSNMIK